jgi:hypothetical protein
MKHTVLVLTALTFGTSAFAADFDTMDADSDGVISEVEFVASYPDAATETLATIDTDGSNSIDKDELGAAIEDGLLPAE